MKLSLTLIAALSAWLFQTSPALSDPAAPAAPAQAPVAQQQPASKDPEALIAEGIEFRKQRRDSEALALFEQAYSLSKTPRAMAQRALAEQALGRWVDAEKHLLEALVAEQDAWIKANNEALRSALSTVQGRLSTVIVHGGVSGAEVRINGQLVGTLPLSEGVRVVAGSVVLDVRHPDYYPLQRQINATAGGEVAETITLTPRPPGGATAGATAATAPASPGNAAFGAPVQPTVDAGAGPSGLSPSIFWIGLGVTGVMGGLTLWSGLDTQSANDDYEQYTRQSDAVFERGQELYDDAKGRQDRTNVFLGLTAALAVGTGVIAALTDFSGSGEASPAMGTPAVGLSEHGAYAGYTGSF